MIPATARLGDHVDILSGFAFDSRNFGGSGEIPVARIRDIVPGQSATFYRGTYDPRWLIDNGDLLVGMDGEFNRARWRGGRALLNQRVCRIRASNGALDEQFLYYFLPDALKAIERATPFVTVKHLSVKQIREIKVPLPPLAEQRRLAEVLDRAEALRAKRRAALDKLDTLTKSLFLDLFGDPATNPRGWPKYNLEQLCSVDAPLVNPTHEEFRNLLHYGPDRIERDNGGLLPAKTAEQDGLISAKFLFDENAILYSKIRPNLNKVALARGRALCSADVYPVEVKRDILSREFLWCLLRSGHFLSYAAEFSNRANIPKLNREQFLGYAAICPPIKLQREFARRVSAVERMKTAHGASLAELDALFATLQHRAFRGEL